MSGPIRDLLKTQLHNTLRQQSEAVPTVLALLRDVQELVHALQRERGSTSLSLSDQNHYYVDLMNDFRREVNSRQDTLLATLHSVLPEERLAAMGYRFFRKLQLSLQALDLLKSLREDINQHRVSAHQSNLAYSQLIEALLGVSFELAQLENPPAIMRLLVALVYVTQAKEFAGQERALLCAGFASATITASIKSSLTHRVDSQNHCLEIFMEQAPEELAARHQIFVEGDVARELMRLRTLAQASGASVGPSDRPALYWFDQSTAYIDHLRDLENCLSQSLEVACGDVKITQAQAFAPTCLPPLPGAEPALGVLATQTSRLLEVEEELRALQGVLNERHLIDRAKALIMSRESITEEEAYQRLRKHSMDTGMKLTAVARQVITRFTRL